MSKHVPDGKTQVNLAVLRWRARTADIQRRSIMKETMDVGEAHLAELREGVMESGYARASETILAAVNLTLE